MSAAALFVPGRGSRWDPLPEQIKALPRKERVVAAEIWWAIIDALEKGQTITSELITDAVLSAHSGWSRSYVQHGLRILEYIAKVIVRTRQHGRRVIRIICQLWGRRDGRPAETDSAPPRTPPEDKDFEKTTTETRSSSSPQKTPEGTIPEKAPDDPAIAGLIVRACQLIPRVTPGEAAWAIGEYTSEWVSRALDRVEERNREPGKKPVKSWGFVLTVLANRRREHWTPPEPQPPPAALPPPARKAPASPPAPPRLLSADQVAELVNQARSPQPVLARFGQAHLRLAVRQGTIGPEQLGTIPAELLPPAGSEVPAAGSGS
jgi:hypothetical protein